MNDALLWQDEQSHVCQAVVVSLRSYAILPLPPKGGRGKMAELRICRSLNRSLSRFWSGSIWSTYGGCRHHSERRTGDSLNCPRVSTAPKIPSTIPLKESYHGYLHNLYYFDLFCTHLPIYLSTSKNGDGVEYWDVRATELPMLPSPHGFGTTGAQPA